MSAYDNWKTTPDDWKAQEDQEAFDERVDEILAEFCKDPKKIAEADEWADGRLDGEQYDAMQPALADLHDMDPDKLLGSAVLERLYALAKVCHDERMKHLRDMAEQQACDELDADEQARAETAMNRRDAA